MNKFIRADFQKCIGCKTCMAGCSEVHKARGLSAVPRINLVQTLEMTVTVACHHCEDPLCAKVCPVKAIATVDDRVFLDEKKCIGCKSCILACPFGAIGIGAPGITADTPDPNQCSEQPVNAEPAKTHDIAIKCDLCGKRKTGPECVRVCPTNALYLVDEAYLSSRRVKLTERLNTL